ncbi:hypothetical protein C1646_772373 [Rhizophagus diaphanus]|nr:hypothetical protein C1646_772373 [Rhizophagus diaphanus] [Rhizophagus sp. MUCL 43196]
MSITLFCLVKGNTTTNAFEAKDLKVWKVTIPDDRDLLSNPTLQDELLATRDIEEYWPEKPPKKHIHVIVEVNRFRFDQQSRFERPQFIKNKVVLNEEDVRVAIDVNICMTLNELTGPDCVYSRKSTDTPGVPDFNCHLVGSLILVIEAMF